MGSKKDDDPWTEEATKDAMQYQHKDIMRNNLAQLDGFKCPRVGPKGSVRSRKGDRVS